MESRSFENKRESLLGEDRAVELVPYRWRGDGWHGAVPQGGQKTSEAGGFDKSWDVSTIPLAKGHIQYSREIVFYLPDVLFVHAHTLWAGASWPGPFPFVRISIPSHQGLLLRPHRYFI